MSKALTFLGKDGRFGRDNTSAYAFRRNINRDRLLLIDCGYAVFPELQTQGILERLLSGEISYVDVIITHLHPNHAGSLGQLAFYCYYILKKQPINIITKCRDFDTFMAVTGVKKVSEHETPLYTRKNDFVEFIETKHVPQLDCYGFSAEINDSHVVYTGDTSDIRPFIGYLEEGTQFFVDASIRGKAHLNLEENLPLLKKLTQDGIKVYLMHLDDEKEIRKMIKDTDIRICDE